MSVEGAGPSDRRARWEGQWAATEAQRFPWYLEEPPDQLRELIRRGVVPHGAALDLGCGDGTITSYLGETFDPAVGVEFSLHALRQARARTTSRAWFVGAEVPRLPFREGTFAFAFDRGCAQNLPKERWSDYFRAVEHVLMAGGVLQLLASRATRSGGSSLGSRIRRALGRDPDGHISEAFVRSSLPNTMEILTLEPFDFLLSTGEVRRFTHGILRKT